MEEKIIFGPVPSRRLGQSLGINNIPPKICSYSCVYCQIGRTKNISTERQVFYPVEKIIEKVSNTLERLKENKETVDFLSFVPDGEPTLDINIGKEIAGLKKFKIKTAVITNSSLLWREDVRRDLKKADLVSLKIDVAGNKEVWEKINRPAPDINYDAVLDGIKKFSAVFKGKLLTETLLVKNINDNEKDMRNTAEFLSEIKPAVAFIGIPTRPPAEKWVLPPDEEKINRAYHLFGEYGLNTELITGGGTGSFGFTGDAEKDLLNIVSVHPMSKKQVEDFLKKAGGSWDIVKKLLKDRKIKEIVYLNQKYYLKNFSK